MPLLVERSTLRWGGRGPANGTDYRWCGIPAASVDGGFVSLAGDATPLASYLTAKNAYALSSRQLMLPKRNGMAPSAISIAPDSAIHACDVSLGGDGGDVTRHRVSPGNPLIGNLDADRAAVTLPFAVPVLAVTSGETLFSDATISPISGVDYGLFPLRLELWYGGLPIRGIYRAPLAAYALFGSTGTDVNRDFTVCVDGRKRIDVKMIVDGITNGAATLKCFSMDAYKSTTALADLPINKQLELNDDGDTSILVDVTTGVESTTVSFFGNPMTFLRVNLTITDAIVHVIVRAMDD